MFIFANPNPVKQLVGDCVIRGISIVKDQTWIQTYNDISRKGREMYDMPSSNAVWNAYLMDSGYRKIGISNTCPNCYTVKDFCIDHPFGVYLVATGTHVVAVIDGNYYDTWDSGDEVPLYYYEREDYR
ncbi:MAG: hypothetical protein J6Y02_00920 [Pseudobutyrivibrio sp.]|nr:hypothetical protein [Pseudobutyrivibrio sp.]